MDVQASLRQEHGTSMKMFSLLQKLLEISEPEESGRDGPLPEMLRLLERYVDDCHHSKEERAVFPRLVKAEAAGALELTRELADEHLQARTLLQRIKEEISGSTSSGAGHPLAEAAQDYLQLMRRHIRKENARLLPMCRDYLQGQAGSRVLELMNGVENELFEAGEKEQILKTFEDLKKKYL